jgi:fatty-acyl-CoA synthase
VRFCAPPECRKPPAKSDFLSYVHGCNALPLIGETIGACFDKVVEQFPDREALVSRHQSIRWTWRELQERVDRLAAALLRLGLKKGDRIGIWSQNNAEWLLTQMATAKTGLILVNINPAYRCCCSRVTSRFPTRLH